MQAGFYFFISIYKHCYTGVEGTVPRGRRREKTARMPSAGTVTGLQGAYRMYATERRLPSTA